MGITDRETISDKEHGAFDPEKTERRFIEEGR